MYIHIFYQVIKIKCAFYSYSTSQLGLAVFQGLRPHRWLVATILGSPDLDYLSVTHYASVIWVLVSTVRFTDQFVS